MGFIRPPFKFLLFTLALSLFPIGSSPASPNNDPLVMNGRQLYRDLRCDYCHRLKGRGGNVGPALDNVGFRRTKEWMADHFVQSQDRYPQAQRCLMSN